MGWKGGVIILSHEHTYYEKVKTGSEEQPYIHIPTSKNQECNNDGQLVICLSAVVGGMLCKSDKPSIIIIINWSATL